MEIAAIQLLPNPNPTHERNKETMARRKKRSSRHSGSPTTPIVTYTVTVAHEPDSECDSCAMPAPMLIEQEGGAWMCERCIGGVSGNDFWKAALITTMPWGDSI